MASNIPEAPTFAEPVLVDKRTGKSGFNPIWLRWFLSVAQILRTTETAHNSLQGLEGDGPEFFHLSADQHTQLTTGQAQAPVNIATGPSPFVWQNTTDWNVIVCANGAGGDTYALSRDNVTFYGAGAGASVSIVVPKGDYIQATFGGGAPVMDYLPF